MACSIGILLPGLGLISARDGQGRLGSDSKVRRDSNLGSRIYLSD